MTQHHTPDTIRAALQHIPPNLPRDEWARVGMAIRSEFPDETGYALFFFWSQPADNFNAKACRDAWKSFKAGGGVTIGTLLHLAKSHGYELPKDGQQAAPPSPEALAERQRQQEQAREREKAETLQRHEAAASEAAKQWASASDEGQSPYLERKGVQAHGLRHAVGGVVLVPLRDDGGKLWNVQAIAADGQKRFLPGGRKSGLWHMLGNTLGTVPAVDDATPGTDAAGAGHSLASAPVLLVAEGYATAATLHQATGYPVAVAFDAGNLDKVANALRQLVPAALLVLCGDDDQATQAKTGHNPGRDKATAAAGAVQGLAVFPMDLPEGGSDFNDMHQAHGLQAVRACVVAAVQAHRQAMQATPAATSASKGNTTPARKNAPAARIRATVGTVAVTTMAAAMAARVRPMETASASVTKGLNFSGRIKTANPPSRYGCAAVWMCCPSPATRTAAAGATCCRLLIRWATLRPGPCPPAC